MRGWIEIRISVLLFVSLIGCSTIPFQRTAEISMEELEPTAVLKNYKKGLPEEINLLNSIVFQYNRQKILGIGQIAANTKEKTFKIVCINPMGLKIFEISGDKDHTRTHFALDRLTRKGDFAKLAGEDIRRVYFDLIPSSKAEIRKDKYELMFKQPSETGVTEYVFAGAGPYLTNKKEYENNRCIREVSYYEYQLKNGKLYPKGIILDNFKYDYRLIIKLKEIQDKPAQAGS